MNTKGFVALAVFALCLAACQNDPRWYPDAEVTIYNYREYDTDGGGKTLLVICVIRNTSDAAITSGAVTVQVKTKDAQDVSWEYLQTIAVSAGIVPGGKIAVSVTVPYLDNTEKVQTDGVVVYDSFFD